MISSRPRPRPVVPLLLLVALAAGCRTPSPDTVLLKKDPGSSVTYRAPGENDVPYAINVVHVPKDARFSLTLESLNPGWLHQPEARRQSSNTPGLPAAHPSLANKDLWLLVHVRSLAAESLLASETKHVTRATLVKADARSFGLLPLTLDEVTPLSLEANTDYDVVIRLYELPPSHERALDERPGLSGVARAAWTTTKDTFKSLAGSFASPAARLDAHNTSPAERRLLAAGGAVRFDARFAIYRSDATLAPRHPDADPRGGVLVNRYQIVDPYNRRDNDRAEPRAHARYTSPESYLEHLTALENADAPGRLDASLRFRVEAMWSPVAKALAQVSAEPARPDNVTREQAAAAESLAATARETFLKVSEEEKQASLAAAETLRKSDTLSAAQLEETARALARKTEQVSAARAAMETAEARALEMRQAVEAAASRAAQLANAEKTAQLASAALENARRATDAALRDLDQARAALQHAREAAEAARLRKENWMQTEQRARLQLDAAREQLASLARKAEKNPDNAALRDKHADAEKAVAEASREVEIAASEWKLAQKDQEAKLAEIEDRLTSVSQKRLAHAEAEQERQRARAAKDQADSQLLGAETTDPRPAILRAPSL